MLDQVQQVSPLSISTKIAEKAKTDIVLKSVCQVFAKRQRARTQITVTHLHRVMKINGFDFAKSQYVDVLRFLANIGVGSLQASPRGEVIALSHIKYRLQSIGKAAGDLKTHITTFTSREGVDSPALKDLNAQTRMPQFVNTVPPTPSQKAQAKRPLRAYNMFLTAIIDGQPVVFQGPKNLPPEDFGDFLLNFNALGRKEGKSN